MKCLCNKNVPRVARGNNFTLIVELQQIVISDEGKEITTQIEGTVGNVKICPSNGEPIGWNDWQMAQTSNGAAVSISIPSAQQIGAYGIEITGTRTGGGAFRWYAKPGEGFIIVDASSDNYLTDMVRIYTITGVVGVGSSGGGGSATVGTLNTNNSTALAPKDMESFDGAINLNRVAKTGNYNDLNNKPTIPAEQIQSDWNQTNTNAKDFIKNKPTIPTKTSDLTNNSGFLTQHQDISGKEDKLTFATALAANSMAEFGKYYRLSLSSATTINLPAVTGNETTLKGFLIYLTVNTGGSVDWNANNNEPIVESGLSSIAEGKTYEVNAAWNGIVWAITANEFTAYSTT